jgi:thiol-disulfide isomerase/thioredoxin
MKILITVLFGVAILNAQGQNIDVSSKNIDSLLVKDKINLIYFNASWCLPCVQKLDTLIKLYPKISDKANLIVLYDRWGFNEQKAKGKYSFFENKPFYLMAKQYYAPKKGMIRVQVNGQYKAFKNLAKDLAAHYNFEFPKKTLLFGDILLVKNKEVKYIEGTGRSIEDFMGDILSNVK